MNVRVALRNRTGLVLLACGLALAVAVLAVPALSPWSALAPALGGIGTLAYLSTVAVLAWPSEPPVAPEVRAVRAVRDAMARRLADRRAGERGGDSGTTRILADALRTLDSQLLPKLVAATARQRSLGEQLDRYDRHELPPPDRATLGRLRSILVRQQGVIDAIVQQAATADATLLALTHEVDESLAESQARLWLDDLTALVDGLSEALGSDADRAPVEIGRAHV